LAASVASQKTEAKPSKATQNMERAQNIYLGGGSKPIPPSQSTKTSSNIHQRRSQSIDHQLNTT